MDDHVQSQAAVRTEIISRFFLVRAFAMLQWSQHFIPVEITMTVKQKNESFTINHHH